LIFVFPDISNMSHLSRYPDLLALVLRWSALDWSLCPNTAEAFIGSELGYRIMQSKQFPGALISLITLACSTENPRLLYLVVTRAHPHKWTLNIDWTNICLRAGTHMGRVILRWRPIRVRCNVAAIIKEFNARDEHERQAKYITDADEKRLERKRTRANKAI
jgi:hypothetical protein